MTINEIPKEALERMVVGVGLSPGALADQLGEGPALLVFLRHFGCIFCKEVVSDLRAAAESRDDYPEVLFFTQGLPAESRAFLRTYWPTARAVSDPDLWFYDAFGVRRASYLEALGPRVLRSRSRARAKGHANGAPSGDIWRMPGVFLVNGGHIQWRYDPEHAADHPDFAQVPAQTEVART